LSHLNAKKKEAIPIPDGKFKLFPIEQEADDYFRTFDYKYFLVELACPYHMMA
jgi:hypothetical protein